MLMRYAKDSILSEHEKNAPDYRRWTRMRLIRFESLRLEPAIVMIFPARLNPALRYEPFR